MTVATSKRQSRTPCAPLLQWTRNDIIERDRRRRHRERWQAVGTFLCGALTVSGATYLLAVIVGVP